MTLSQRDRRALGMLGVMVAVMAVIYFWPQPSVETTLDRATDVESAALRLERLRGEAAQRAAREDSLTRSRAELAAIEKGLIPGDSIAQTQAQLVQIVRRVARSQVPPVDLRSNEFGPARPMGDQYAELLLNLSLDCQIDQLVNLLSDVAGQPELLAVEELHVNATASKNKSVNVRMTVSGVARGLLLKLPRAGAL